MALSARLSRRVEAALERFCRAKGITKTEAAERAILLLEQDQSTHHAAYFAYRQLELVPEAPIPVSAPSSEPMRASIRAKYPH